MQKMANNTRQSSVQYKTCLSNISHIYVHQALKLAFALSISNV